MSSFEDQQRALKLKYGIMALPKLGANFWSIPKCANTSVKYACFQAIGMDIQHDPGDIYLQLHSIGIAEYIDKHTAASNGLFNFAIIRNPATRTLSMYRDLAIKRRGKTVEGSRKFVREWLKMLEREHSFSDFVRLLARHPESDRDLHFRSYTPRLALNKRFVPDMVICLEDLEGRLTELNQALAIPIEIPHLHQTPGAATFSEQDLERLKAIWRNDYRLWLKHKL